MDCKLCHKEVLQQNRMLNEFPETAVVHEIISDGVLHRSIPRENANLDRDSHRERTVHKGCSNQGA